MSDIAVQIKEQVYQVNFPRYVAGTIGSGSVAWNDVTGKPATFTPSAHTHPIADVTNLQTSLDAKAASSHGHAIGDVSGLQTALDGKSATGHGHSISDVTGLQTALDSKAGSTHAGAHVTGGADKIRDASASQDGLMTTAQASKLDGIQSGAEVNVNADWNAATGDAAILNKPATFPPSTHGHSISDVSGLQTALDGKSATGHGHVIADVSGLQTALDGKAASVHTHAIADVTGLQTILDDADGTKLNQATIKLVRKSTAGTITKGQVVYIVGSQGTHLTVELADADSEATAATTIGVAMGNITSTVDGYIIVQGYLNGLSNLPTASFTEGAALWLSQTSGGWTTTRPTQPAHGVFLGWVVTSSNGSAGRAYIKIINGQELDELHDVLITSPADDQVLTYEAATGLWKNKTPTGGGGGGITNEQSIVNALIFG